MNDLTTRSIFLIVLAWSVIASNNELGAQVPVQPNLRTWYAAAGGFKVDAELVDVREGKVQLKKADGTLLWVPLDKLSLADAKFVSSEMQKVRQSVEKATDGKNGQTEDTDANSMDLVPPEVASDGSDPETDLDDRGLTSTGTSKGTRSPFAGMRESNLVLGRVSPQDIIFPQILSPWLAMRQIAGGGHQYTIANIRTSKLSNPFSVEGFATTTALSPDGATLAVFTSPPKLTLYSTTSGRKIREIDVGQSSFIQSMAFVSPTQLLVDGSFNSPATIYDVKSGRVAKTLAITGRGSNKLAISPDGKYLAFPNNSVIALYDLKSGKLKSQLAVVPDKGSKNLSVNIEDLAFCNDGTELAAIASGTTSEFQVFSLRTGRAVIKHTLSERLSNSMHVHQYKGPAVESIPGDKGYILYGSVIIDREKGGPIWMDKSKSGDSESLFRVMIDDERQIKLSGNYGAVQFEIVKLPWSEISQSKDLVAKGGTVEDAGLPLVKNVNSRIAKSVDGTLNPKLYAGKQVDIEIAAAPSVIPIDRSFGDIYQLRFASPSSGICVSMPSLFGMLGDNKKKHALVIDLKKGSVAKSVNVSFLAQIQDVSPDGKWLIGTTGKNNDRVDIFDLSEGKHEVGFRPSISNDYGARLNGASFLSDNIFVTITQREATAWEFPELRPLYKFQVMGSVFRFPKSPLFMHRNEQGWCVRNADDGKLRGILENSNSLNTEFARSAHIRADESQAAAVVGFDRDQKLIVWDLLTGKRTHVIALGSFALSRMFLTPDGNGRIASIEATRREPVDDARIPKTDSVAWVGADQLLVRWTRNDADRFAQGTNVSQLVYSLFDLKSNRMLWDYRVPIGGLVEGGPEGQLWFVESTQRLLALVGAKIPTSEAMGKIAKAPAPTRLIADGEQLMADVQVNISGDKLADGVLRDQVVSKLVKNLAANNNDVSERAGVKLTVRIDRIGADYGSSNAETPKLLASARLTDISNNVLWQRERMITAEQAEDPARPILAENVRRLQWENALTWIGETIDPKQIYESWYYRGIGESILSAEGEKIVELRAK